MKKVILTMLVVAGIFAGCADKATPTETNATVTEANATVTETNATAPVEANVTVDANADAMNTPVETK